MIFPPGEDADAAAPERRAPLARQLDPAPGSEDLQPAAVPCRHSQGGSVGLAFQIINSNFYISFRTSIITLNLASTNQLLADWSRSFYFIPNFIHNSLLFPSLLPQNLLKLPTEKRTTEETRQDKHNKKGSTLFLQ